MNLRNTMINDLIRIKHGEITKKEFKQIKNKEYNNKSNSELFYMWKEIRCYIEAEEELEKHLEYELCDEYEIFRFL